MFRVRELIEYGKTLDPMRFEKRLFIGGGEGNWGIDPMHLEKRLFIGRGGGGG